MPQISGIYFDECIIKAKSNLLIKSSVHEKVCFIINVATKLQIFVIYNFLIMERRPYQNFLKFAQKFILFFYFSLNEKNITVPLLMMCYENVML